MFASIAALSTIASTFFMPLTMERPMDVFGTTMTVEVSQARTGGEVRRSESSCRPAVARPPPTIAPSAALGIAVAMPAKVGCA